MKYSFDSRIRFSEVGENGHLTLAGILNYFQDSSTFQSEGLNQGMQNLQLRNRVWVLSSWQVIVKRYPTLGEQVTITTWPHSFKGFFGGRNFTLTTADGEMLAWANSIWTNLDVEKGIPARLTQEDMNGYELSEKLDMEYAPRKIRVPDTWEAMEPFRILRHHLDTNHHVNNCQYINMAADCLPDGFVFGEMRAEYKKQVWLGELLYPHVTIEEDLVTVVLCDQDQTPCTIVQFLAQKAN